MLLVLLLAGSAPAYAYKGEPAYKKYTLVCSIVDLKNDFWYSVNPFLPGELDLETVSVAQDQIWQEIDGVLVPAYPDVGTDWECWFEGHWMGCEDWCFFVVDIMVLFEEVRIKL